MANIYRVREIERAGQPTGKFRMTEASDESSDSTIFGLCEHEHDTQNEARLCPVVVAKLERIFPPTPACPTCDELTKRIEELEAHLRKIHDRAHSWNNIPACGDIEQMAAQALGLKGGA